MNIKKTSWHFKLVAFFNDSYPSSSLCIYIRQLIIAMGMALFLAVICVAGLIVFVGAPLQAIAGWFGLISITKGELIAGGVVLGVYLAAGVVSGAVWSWKQYRARNPYKKPLPKEPNIVMAYIKAKKEMFCPQIKFV
jgi:hypothetical protein